MQHRARPTITPLPEICRDAAKRSGTQTCSLQSPAQHTMGPAEAQHEVGCAEMQHMLRPAETW